MAIVTGRRIADVRERLGFAPPCDRRQPRRRGRRRPRRRGARARARSTRCASACARAPTAWPAPASLVEDKGQSLALHFRTAPDRAAASALIEDVLAGFTPALHVFGGKLVYNAVAADAPDKAVRRAAR